MFTLTVATKMEYIALTSLRVDRSFVDVRERNAVRGFRCRILLDVCKAWLIHHSGITAQLILVIPALIKYWLVSFAMFIDDVFHVAVSLLSQLR